MDTKNYDNVLDDVWLPGLVNECVMRLRGHTSPLLQTFLQPDAHVSRSYVLAPPCPPVEEILRHRLQ